MNVTHAVNLFILYESRNQSNFSKTTSHIHSKFSHLHCHLTEVVNTFSLSFSLLPGLTPDINPVTTDDYCIGFRIVLNRLLKFQRFSLNLVAGGMPLDLILNFWEFKPIRVILRITVSLV